MSLKHPINVVLMWHMHQPHYQDLLEDRFVLPWTYLHAIKDYSDMAYALEQNPGARAVVNFTPVLLRQLDEYQRQLRRYFDELTPPGDPLLAALAADRLPTDRGARRALVAQCLRANRKRLIERFPVYRQLAGLADTIIADEALTDYFSDHYLFDLLTWYHLAWMGESIRQHDGKIKMLMEKGRGFTHADRQTVLHCIAREVEQVIPRYRKLRNEGRVELSFTPEDHPIAPLLIDFQRAVESQKNTVLPPGRYPGGSERARWHIEQGLATFARHFDSAPVGCWPAEGALCERTLQLLDRAGVTWAASGGAVLGKSLAQGHQDEQCIHHPFKIASASVRCFFRDDHISDMIGFTYQDWHEEDAVNNLVHHVENIRRACEGHPDAIVPIILDGENCWEYYSHNGYFFLQKLYQKLASHPHITLTTFSEYLATPRASIELNNLVPGSWVYGDFSTWIGHPDKNRAWELLCEAKAVYDHVMAEGTLDAERQQQAAKQLAICESSDWFWWFGDYNPADSVRDFDRLYRSHLQNLYRLLEQPAPANLKMPLSIGQGTPEQSGVMRRAQ